MFLSSFLIPGNIKIQTFLSIHPLGYNYIFPRIITVAITVKKLDRGGESEQGKQNLPIKW